MGARKRDKFKPAASKNGLIFLAGFVWSLVGLLLLWVGMGWLGKPAQNGSYLLGGMGLALGLIVHHFGFLRIVDKNLERLLPMTDMHCLFAFIPWKSYAVIAIMAAMGYLLRHSAIPKQYLAIIYNAVGFALVLSSVRYWRFFIQQHRNIGLG
jgi:hypothetical protein